GLAPVLGKAHTISSLLPLVLVLLRDEYPEVRLNVIARLHAVNSVIGVELLAQSLLPAVVQLGVELFDAELSKLCTAWLADCVAIANLKKLIAVFGVEWAQQRLLPEVASARPGSAYHKRMTALLTARLLAETLPAEVLASSLLPLTLELAKDPVPNIRFNAAKTLGALVPALVRGGQAAAVQSRVKPALTALLGDPDTDVQFYATQALELVQN
ncbi:armadillo-type protein, partial [Pavlovales sp. CCMP2436]